MSDLIHPSWLRYRNYNIALPFVALMAVFSICNVVLAKEKEDIYVITACAGNSHEETGPQGTQCVCDSGYVRLGEDCIPVPPDGIGPGPSPNPPPPIPGGGGPDGGGGGTVGMDKTCSNPSIICAIMGSETSQCAKLKCRMDYCSNKEIMCTEDEKQKGRNAENEYNDKRCDSYQCRERRKGSVAPLRPGGRE